MLPVVTTSFTPLASLLGGVLIGISTVMLMGLLGRIAGISGITLGALGSASDWGWRLAFLAGIIGAPLAVELVGGTVESTVSTNLVGMAVAGLLVGFGTGLGSGCTSGHGVCGLARLSPRSAAAVGVFMVTAVATVIVLRHAEIF
ncbi:YeeE/YedE family protein [Acuticoccus mangrovi]|uniref:YeeE/YedE family protein n=1 Tax=Acuticoccus mangrovi TaxID=2796142 RepID=A0A934MEJ7_9HYPH|nr:YeeE/YedE family protein [Acuticoccus mangrovi]MBJ3777597.1 YeeE/YedE family protein [Acuticoccus mangrovi]